MKSKKKIIHVGDNDRCETCYNDGKKDACNEIDEWFDGRSEMEIWEWHKIKRDLIQND